MKKSIEVVGAVIVREGNVLCTQRGGNGPLAGKWEFPGGKVEHGEAPRDALTREIREELRCTISVGEELVTTTHDDDFATIILTTFYCSIVDGHPTLTEHTEMRWVAAHALGALDWAPADIPAVTLIEERLKGPAT